MNRPTCVLVDLTQLCLPRLFSSHYSISKHPECWPSGRFLAKFLGSEVETIFIKTHTLFLLTQNRITWSIIMSFILKSTMCHPSQSIQSYLVHLPESELTLGMVCLSLLSFHELWIISHTGTWKRKRREVLIHSSYLQKFHLVLRNFHSLSPLFWTYSIFPQHECCNCCWLAGWLVGLLTHSFNYPSC